MSNDSSLAGRKVGLIGLGAMGSGMAGRCAAPAPSCASATPAKGRAGLRRRGRVACATPAELAAACEVVISVVVNAAQTESVLFGDSTAWPRCRRPGSSS